MTMNAILIAVDAESWYESGKPLGSQNEDTLYINFDAFWDNFTSEEECDGPGTAKRT
ncbi:hypothetical protein [Paenibacillus vandeheii]|uniref:hypothetical protein n=1 Tax=Paenibacillus vandeheii TaxID=3035917 RepID=UPI003425EAD3